MGEFATNGKANAGVALGTVGTALGGLMALGGNGLFGNLLGGANHVACNENIPVNRYEAAQSARIAELETEIKLRDANIYTDGKLLDLYKYFDSELKGVRAALCEQAVRNKDVEGAFALVRADIANEREKRCCADNAIVNYVNQTFYPKLVADVTAGTTTTAQTLYNPLPNCGCGCGGHN
jgi:hypothetical protein